MDRKCIPRNSGVCTTCELNDYVGLSFELADLTRGPASLSFRSARNLTHEDIWQLMSSLAQSAGGFDIAENFIIRVFKISVPIDRGRQSNRLTREDVAKRSILQINNTEFVFSLFARSDIRASRA